MQLLAKVGSCFRAKAASNVCLVRRIGLTEHATWLLKPLARCLIR
jgi:hypothetical protein